MLCPQCTKQMQVFTLRGLELDRCRECSRVWLDLNEVDALLGTVEVRTSDTEVDQPCPRGHGPMMSGAVKEQPAIICSTCRGAWLIDTVSPAEAPAPKEPTRPAPVRPPKEAKPGAPVSAVQVTCELCAKKVPLSEAANTSRGMLCRSCELTPPNPGELSPYERYLGPGQDSGAAVGRVLKALLED